MSMTCTFRIHTLNIHWTFIRNALDIHTTLTIHTLEIDKKNIHKAYIGHSHNSYKTGISKPDTILRSLSRSICFRNSFLGA